MFVRAARLRLNSNVGVCVADILQKSIVLLANERLAMMAGNIVPVNSVVVEVIQYGKAVLVGATLLQFTVVRLWLTDASVGRPIVLVAVGGWSEFLQLSGPEPSVDSNRLQIWAVASLEVADAATRPDILDL